MTDQPQRPLRIGPLATGGVIAAACVLLVNGWLSFRNFDQAAQAETLVEHALTSQAQVERLYAAISNAVAAQRAYLATGDTALLPPYAAAMSFVESELAVLEAHTTDNAVQQERLAAIRDEIEALWSILTREVERRERFDVHASDTLVSAVRRISAEMATEESRIVTVRRESASTSRTEALVAFTTATGTALIMVLLTYGLLRRDIRLRREVTTELARHARYNRIVLDSTGEGLFGVDRNGALTFINATAGRLLGLDPEAVQGQSMHGLFHDLRSDGSVMPESEDRIIAAARGLASSNVDGEVFSRPDGSTFPIEYTASPLQDNAGQGGAVVAFNDITKRKVTEHFLLAAKADAEFANIAKSQFLANMSHELRTPLNAVILYSELLKEEALDAGHGELVDDLEKIRGAGRHLLALVNGVLDLSKIEAGKTELYLETFDIEKLANEVVATVLPLCRKRGTTLVVACQPRLGPMRADITKVRQILFNLLSNACKFTTMGSITLSLSRKTASAHLGARPELVMDVTDTGIGMSPAEVKRLFQPFVQADASTTRRFGGTGLGLAISQRFAELMDGCITVVSAPDKGSTFTLVLPFEVPSLPPLPERVEPTPSAPVPVVRSPTPDAPSSEVVLIVEDDELTRDILGRALTREGWSVAKAGDGRAALTLLGERPVGIVLLDLMMPKMDGFEFLVELEKEPTWQTIPVVVLTARDLTPLEREHLMQRVTVVQSKAAPNREALLREVTDIVRAVAAGRTKPAPSAEDAALPRLPEDLPPPA